MTSCKVEAKPCRASPLRRTGLPRAAASRWRPSAFARCRPKRRASIRVTRAASPGDSPALVTASRRSGGARATRMTGPGPMGTDGSSDAVRVSFRPRADEDRTGGRQMRTSALSGGPAVCAGSVVDKTLSPSLPLSLSLLLFLSPSLSLPLSLSLSLRAASAGDAEARDSARSVWRPPRNDSDSLSRLE